MRCWLVAAAVLHAGVAAALALHGQETPPPLSLPGGVPAVSPGLLWLEDMAAVPDVAAAGQPGPSSSGGEPLPKVAFASSPSAAAAVSGAVTIGTASIASVNESSADLTIESSESSPPEVGTTDADGVPKPPRLSLRDLGVGPLHNRRLHNPFLQQQPDRPSRAQVLNARLRHSLRSGLASHDQKLGLGPEGPAVVAIKSIVSNSPTTNTSGLLGIRTDATGLVVHVEVLQASSDGEEWRRIAAELERALAHQRLRVPSGSAGVTLELRVVSRVQMPSGADPGFSVALFGHELREGGGSRSAGLDLFSPELIVQEVEIPYTEGRHTMPSVSVKLGGLKGDLADIGAVARRIVSAHLVAMETHAAEPAAQPSLRGVP